MTMSKGLLGCLRSTGRLARGVSYFFVMPVLVTGIQGFEVRKMRKAPVCLHGFVFAPLGPKDEPWDDTGVN